jgi:hypothetical protein
MEPLMDTTSRFDLPALTATILSLAGAGPCLAQGSSLGFETGDGKTHVIVHEIPAEANDPASIERRAWLAGVENELRKLNAQYLRSIRNVQIRQVGLSKLRTYNDPAVWPTLLEVFDRAKEDVHMTLLDMFQDHASDEGDATLAWIATFEEDDAFRAEAAKRLYQRAAQTESVSSRIESVVAYALKSDDNKILENAADLANRLDIVAAIPALISAQLSGSTVQTGRDDAGGGALAYILIGTQVAFVSDLTPVVGDSAVAFDPTVAVATDGVVLSIGQAVVTTYRLEVHNSLVGLSSRAWGQSTSPLGWDQEAWKDWYADEFLPHLEEQRRAEIAARTGTPDDGPG